MSLVSFLVPMYNVEKYLSRCLESLVNQTYKDIEIVIINDGSRDRSRDIAKLYEERYDFVHIYDYENAGISCTRNRCLEKANGDYLMFVDSDDYLEKDAIEKMMNIMISNACDIVTCGYVMDFGPIPFYRKVSSKQTLDSLDALHSLVANTGVNNYPWAKLFSKDCFKDVSFPQGLKGFEDTCTVFKAICNAKKICTIPDRFYHYCQRRGSLTYKMDLDTVYEMRKAYEYQQSCLNKLYPDEKFSFDIHFFNSDMVILYTLILFCPRKDNPVYEPGDIDWSKINPFMKVIYRAWLQIACVKFGWSSRQVLENR